MEKAVYKRIIIFILFRGALLAGGLLLFMIVYQRIKVPCYRCNIIIISINTFRADVLPCLSYPLPTAPNLCQYANENILFSNAYTNASLTRPSNISLFTSLYPYQHGITSASPISLNRNIQTLSQVLAQNGYDTTFVNEDRFYLAVDTGLGRGFKTIRFTDGTVTPKTLDAWYKAIDAMRLGNNRHVPAFVYIHTEHIHDYENNLFDVPTNFVLDPGYRPILKPTVKEQFTEQTRALTLGYLDHTASTSLGAHEILQNGQWLTAMQNAKTLTEASMVFRTLPLNVQQSLHQAEAIDRMKSTNFDAFVTLSRHLYDESLRTLDEKLALLFDRIRDAGLADNTIVIIVGEHGEVLGEHDMIGHDLHTIYEEEIHIPMIMRIPGIAHQIFPALAQLIDVYPTVLELVGLPFPQGLSGISLKKRIYEEPNAPTNDYSIAHLQTAKDEVTSIRTNRWRMIETVPFGGNTAYELYDHARDPMEHTNLAHQKPEVVSMLLRYLTMSKKRQLFAPPIRSLFPYWTDTKDRQEKIESGYFF